MLKKIVVFSLLLFCIVNSEEIDTTSVNATDEQYQPVNIVSIKQDYYKKQGLEILPEFLPDTTLGPGEFVAITNVTIKKGSGVTLNPGTTIWFEPQKKLIVEGILNAASMENQKIRLTYLSSRYRYLKISLADSLWNGIYVEEGGTLLLNRVVISYATTGITVGAEKINLDLACIDMSENVSVPLNYNGKTINGVDVKCFGLDDIERGLNADKELAKKEAIKKEKENAARKRMIWRITSGVVTTAGIGAGAYGFYNFTKYRKLYIGSKSSEGALLYKTKVINNFYVGLAGGIITIIGASGLTLTFVF